MSILIRDFDQYFQEIVFLPNQFNYGLRRTVLISIYLWHPDVLTLNFKAAHGK